MLTEKLVGVDQDLEYENSTLTLLLTAEDRLKTVENICSLLTDSKKSPRINFQFMRVEASTFEMGCT